MLLADRWKEYELIDTSCKERLEQWGDYRLIRPDPQVLWATKKGKEWKTANAHYHRSKKGGGEWDIFSLPEQWSIKYSLPAKTSNKNDLIFNLKPFSFKHTGVFPEQAANWDFMSEKLTTAANFCNQPKVLNLFAYTGGASLACAASGAFVTHVDASRGIVGWAKENAASSRLPSTSIRWIVDDCVKFVEREIRRGNHYDALVMDPPSYGRGPKGEIWKLEDEIFPLIQASIRLLSDTPIFFIINSYTAGIQPSVMKYMAAVALKNAGFKKFKITADELGLPVKNNDLILPCGSTCRVEF